MRPRPPGLEVLGLGVFHRHVVDQPQRGLVLVAVGVMRPGEEILGKAHLQREAGQDAHPQFPVLPLEPQHLGAEARQLVLGWPEARHVGPGDLVAFLVVGRPGRGADLRLELPARVGALGHGILRLDLARQLEELPCGVEGGVDVLLRDAVVEDLEEADLGRGFPQRIRDPGLAVGEIRHVDGRNLAGDGGALAADRGFLVQLGQGIGRASHCSLLGMREQFPGHRASNASTPGGEISGCPWAGSRGTAISGSGPRPGTGPATWRPARTARPRPAGS